MQPGLGKPRRPNCPRPVTGPRDRWRRVYTRGPEVVLAQGLYLGREVDPKSGALGARLDLDPRDLLTHGLIVGMTGSGKTGLAVAMIEEALRKGVPVLAIDPKGD